MSAEADLYDFSAARTAAQRQYMEELASRHVCVLCPSNVATEQREPIEHMGVHWYLKRNDYPYDGVAHHYLVVARRHVVDFAELPDEAGAELWVIKRRLQRTLAPLALATVERSGDMRYNGGSVAHLHVHIVALSAAPSATVRFRVSAHAARTDDGEPSSALSEL